MVREGVDAVIEVTAKVAVFHMLFQVAMGGANQAELRLDGLGASNPEKGAGFQQAQQFDLQ